MQATTLAIMIFLVHFHFKFCFPKNSMVITKEGLLTGDNIIIPVSNSILERWRRAVNKLLTLFENKQASSTYC